MQKYKDDSGTSGVVAYRIGPHWIKVKFKSGEVYKYSYKSAGENHIENMKELAQKGKGLSGYISKYVHNPYE